MMKPKNWSHFQHYKDRCPPWIKLHKELLNDRAFMTLPTASKALAPLLWLLASESKDGTFDASIDELTFRLRMPESDIKTGLKHLIDKGFFVDDSEVLAECYQDAIPETETETETETKKSRSATRGSRLPADWKPNAELAEWSKAERPDLNLRKVLEEFRDYWTSVAGSKGVKLKWDATWRNWVRSQKADKQTFAQVAADVARTTVPAPANQDAALKEIMADRKKAVPMPAHIRDQINSAFKRA
jgi:hypothetical protein